MREIEFRGKNSANEWLYGYLTKQLWSDCFIIESQDCLGWVITETIGQYTGLKDKNGTKIFEGDIFGDSSRREIDVVIFEDGCFKLKSYGFVECCLDGNAYEERWGEWDCQPICNFCLEHDEILGNIYDNPELIRGEYENK